MSSPQTLIVGAGVAGLSAALLLQHSGARVTILESHDKVGGCAGYFSAGEFQFPTGATAVLGLEPGGLHRQIFDIIGAPLPLFEPIDGLRVFLPDRQIFMAHDAKTWRNERRKLAGNSRGQLLFWKMQELVADAGWSSLSIGLIPRRLRRFVDVSNWLSESPDPQKPQCERLALPCGVPGEVSPCRVR